MYSRFRRLPRCFICSLAAALVLLVIIAVNNQHVRTADDMNDLTEGDLELAKPPRLVVYNMVQKCGSSSLRAVLSLTSNTHKRYVHYVGNHNVQDLSLQSQRWVLGNISRLQKLSGVPLMLSRHVFFIDFKSFGYEMPIYINVVRDPVERFVSYFTYFKLKRQSEELKDVTLEQCVESDLPYCAYRNMTIIQWFCGMSTSPQCRSGGRPAMEQAMYNVRKYYLLVGLQEDMHNFTWALERTLPYYFKGLFNIYTRDEVQKNLSPERVVLPSTRTKLMQLLRYDYEFYHFIRQRFYTVLHTLRNAQKNINTFEGVSRGTYEHPCQTTSQKLRSFLEETGLMNRCQKKKTYLNNYVKTL